MKTLNFKTTRNLLSPLRLQANTRVLWVLLGLMVVLIMDRQVLAQKAEESDPDAATQQAGLSFPMPSKELDWRVYDVEGRLEEVAAVAVQWPPSNVSQGLAAQELGRQLRADWFPPSRQLSSGSERLPVPERVQLQRLVVRLTANWSELQALEERLSESVKQSVVVEPEDSKWRWAECHLQLDLGCRLAGQQKFDAAEICLRKLKTTDVIFPAQLLFYRGMSNYKLLRFAAARQDLELLLKHRSHLDRRTLTLADLMVGDIPESEDSSLHQVARLMDAALRRQSLNEAGQRVLDDEASIVDMLEQLIDQKEQQQKQQQQQQGQAQSKSARPMDKGMRAPLLGKGEVDPRQMTAKQWGDLPPQEQAKVITEMTRQMPPHYKKVVEEYFRRLSEERVR